MEGKWPGQRPGWCLRDVVLAELPALYRRATVVVAPSRLDFAADRPQKVMEAFMYRFHPQWITARRLAHEGTMATCGTGCWGTFDVSLPYVVSNAQWGTLRAWADSPKDGSPLYVRPYPVWLVPPG